jgi:hypothetical protein
MKAGLTYFSGINRSHVLPSSLAWPQYAAPHRPSFLLFGHTTQKLFSGLLAGKFGRIKGFKFALH